MKNCYELTLEYICILGDLERAIDKKSKAGTPAEHSWLDTEINKLELRMIEIKNILKNINTY